MSGSSSRGHAKITKDRPSCDSNSSDYSHVSVVSSTLSESANVGSKHVKRPGQVEDCIWENERRLSMFTPYSAGNLYPFDLPNFSDIRDSSIPMSKSSVELPDSACWEWVGDWVVICEKSDEFDSEGWQYSDSFENPFDKVNDGEGDQKQESDGSEWGAELGTSQVRRRLWTRPRAPKLGITRLDFSWQIPLPDRKVLSSDQMIPLFIQENTLLRGQVTRLWARFAAMWSSHDIKIYREGKLHNSEVSNLVLARSALSPNGSEGGPALTSPTGKKRYPNFDDIIYENFSFAGVKEEHVEEYYSCAIQRIVLRHGWLYVTQNYLFFYSSLLSVKTVEYIRLDTIDELNKVSQLFVNKGLRIVSRGKTLEFFSFTSRNETYHVIRQHILSAKIKLAERPNLDDAISISKGPSSPQTDNNSNFNNGVDDEEEIEDGSPASALLIEPGDLPFVDFDCSESSSFAEPYPTTFVNSQIPFSPAEIFAVAYASTSNLSTMWRECTKSWDVSVGPWNFDDRWYGREITFRNAVNGPIGPKSTAVREFQRVGLSEAGVLLVDSSMSMLEIPYGDYFCVDVRCIYRPKANGLGCTLHVSSEVVFNRWCLWKHAISLRCMSEGNRSWIAFEKMLIEHCKNSRIPELKPRPVLKKTRVSVVKSAPVLRLTDADSVGSVEEFSKWREDLLQQEQDEGYLRLARFCFIAMFFSVICFLVWSELKMRAFENAFLNVGNDL